MSAWPMVALGELCDIRIGRTPSRKEPSYWGPGHPWATISDLNRGHMFDKTRETITDAGASAMPSKVPAGTVLMSFKLSLGKTARAAIDTYTNEAIVALPIRDNNRIIPEFLELALRTVRWDDLASRAAKGKTLNRSSLQLAKVPVPPIEKQRRIAKFLHKTDESKRSINNMKEMLDSAILRRATYLHHRPGTPHVKLSSIVKSFNSGKSFVDSQDDSPASWFVLRVGAVSSGNFAPTQAKPLATSYSPPEAHRVYEGDLLINRSNTPELVGQVAYVWDDPLRVALPDTIWKFVWHDACNATPIYLWATLRTPHMRHAIHEISGGTSSSMSKINRARMMELTVPWPSHEERVEFQQFARVAKETCGLINQQHERARELHDSLQYRAFRGEL